MKFLKKFPFYDILIVKVQADFIHINIFVKVGQSKKNQCMNIKKLFSTHNFKLSLVLLISEDVFRKFAKRSSRHFYAYTIKHLLFTYYSWVQSPTEEGIFPQVEYRFLFRQQFPSLQLQVPSVKIWMQ